MRLDFTKYHGAGNDFILVDDREVVFPVERWEWVRDLCSRRLGIGADGLILVRSHPVFTFEMIYFNADGHLGSFCGNGSRAAIHFWNQLNPETRHGTLLARDGEHPFELRDDGLIQVEMHPSARPQPHGAGWFIDTGSPHYLQWFDADAFHQLDLLAWARPIRHASDFAPGGTNVNALLKTDAGVQMRTFERGVEDETLSCGTGVTAAACLMFDPDGASRQEVRVTAPGGEFLVVQERSTEGSTGTRIFLIGPAKRLYDGIWGA